MDGATIVILLLTVVISIILIMSVVHISAKVDDIDKNICDIGKLIVEMIDGPDEDSDDEDDNQE